MSNKLIIKILIAACLILGMLLIFSNKRANRHKQSSDNFEILAKDSTRYYKTKLGYEVATRKTLQVSNQDLKKGKYVSDSLLDDITRKFKKVQAAVIIKTRTKFDTIQIRYDSIINYEFRRVFTKNDSWYRIKGVSTNRGITLSQVDIPITLRLVSGKKSNWFKTIYTTDASIDNPNVKVKEIISQTVTNKKKRWVLGVGGLVDITGNVNAGLFFGYSLIRL